jgi:hypothetical protein
VASSGSPAAWIGWYLLLWESEAMAIDMGSSAAARPELSWRIFHESVSGFIYLWTKLKKGSNIILI